MMTTTYLHDQEASEGVRQSNAMGLAIKRYVRTLVIYSNKSLRSRPKQSSYACCYCHCEGPPEGDTYYSD